MKRFRVILLAVLLAGCMISAARAEETNGRKLTVMVYMCGSNLESQYGSATADIEEMKASGFPADETAVLVMMGGAGSWRLNPDLDETIIMEISPGRQRIVWRSEQQNMGSSHTLTELLRFGRKNYPADDYALILWDHGGGPLEGVCWDELFAMDHLTLYELTEGIQAAWLGRKLSWIGFDACLMGSAEVAAEVAPYAEYMIASQETEPAKGWNYAFLRDADGDGAATGLRIVDSYFEGLADSRDALTMACIDLSKMELLTAGMEEFFAAVDETVSEENFAELSRIRSASSGFGKSVRAIGEEGYDLVDLADLIGRYGGGDSALSEALEEAVVYVRSDSGKAGGLSVYHPYTNKKKYLESWQRDYLGLEFSAAYTRYITHFGSILTGEDYVDWSGLEPTGLGTGEDGARRIGLQLTEEQADSFLAGEMLIMAGFSDPEDTKALAPVSVSSAAMDENGRVTAEYRGSTLYVEDENGEILQGPVSFLLTDDGYYAVLVEYSDYSSRMNSQSSTFVLYHCTLNSETGELEVVRTYVYDDASGTYTNRIPFSEEGFTDANFFYFIRYLPDPAKPIPGFEEWESFDGYRARNLKLPAEWHLRFRNEWNNTDLYAVFRITDTRQNTWSSIPLQIDNPKIKDMEVLLTAPETEGIELRSSASSVSTLLYPSLRIRLEIRNGRDYDLSINGSDLILNGSRTISDHFNLYPEAGERQTSEISVSPEDMTGLDGITSVDFTLSVRNKEDDWQEPFEIPVHMEMTDGVSDFRASAAPEALDEFRDGEIVWQLISMRQNADGSVSGVIRVRNESSEELRTSGPLLINGTESGDTLSVHVYPGTDAYFTFRMQNSALISHYPLEADGSGVYLMEIRQALEQAGIRTADQVEFYPGMNGGNPDEGVRRIVLKIPGGVRLAQAEEVPEPAVLMDDGGIRVRMEQVLIADNGIGIGLRLENDTDETQNLKVVRSALNGTEDEDFDAYYFNITMLPHTRAVECLTFRHSKGIRKGTAAEELSFRFQEGSRLSTPVTIRFPSGTVFGAAGGTELAGAATETTAAAFEGKPMVMSETIAVPDGTIRPVTVTAPLTKEEADRLDNGNVSLCILTREKGEYADREGPVTRTIARISLQRTGDEWTATLSGLAAVVQGHFVSTMEKQLADNSWELSPSNLFFYPEAGTCDPGDYGLFFGSGTYLYSSIDAAVENRNGQIILTDSSVRLNSFDFGDSRNNRYLDEIAEAAVDQRVFYGTNRRKNMNSVDYSEVYMLSLEEPVTLTLAPYESVEGTKCLYYALFFTDGSREDLIIDPESGEVLDRTFMPAE